MRVPSVEGDDYGGYRFMTGVVRIGKGPCLGEDKVLLEHRAYDSEGKYPSGQKGQLAVWEEPPVKDASLLPPPSTTVAWDGSAQPAKGTARLGATYADALELVAGPGTCTWTRDARRCSGCRWTGASTWRSPCSTRAPSTPSTSRSSRS